MDEYILETDRAQITASPRTSDSSHYRNHHHNLHHIQLVRPIYRQKLFANGTGLDFLPVEPVRVINVMETSFHNLRQTSPHVHATLLLSVQELFRFIILSNVSLFPADCFVILQFYWFLHGGVCGKSLSIIFLLNC